MADKKISFEEAYSGLEGSAAAISSDRVSLESAIEHYKKGKEYYNICKSILDEAKQLIEVYDREQDKVMEDETHE